MDFPIAHEAPSAAWAGCGIATAADSLAPREAFYLSKEAEQGYLKDIEVSLAIFQRYTSFSIAFSDSVLQVFLRSYRNPIFKSGMDLKNRFSVDKKTKDRKKKYGSSLLFAIIAIVFPTRRMKDEKN